MIDANIVYSGMIFMLVVMLVLAAVERHFRDKLIDAQRTLIKEQEEYIADLERIRDRALDEWSSRTIAKMTESATP